MNGGIGILDIKIVLLNLKIFIYVPENPSKPLLYIGFSDMK